MAIQDQSVRLFEQAQMLIPGGVNSPVRAFRSVGGSPVFFKSGLGSRLTSVDGLDYIDYVGSWGPMILGHAFPAVIDAVTQAAANGLSFGAPSSSEVALAAKIVERVPSVERVRMVNSGTEAVMSAVRLARGFTKRDKIIKFAGCYHGHSDSLLVAAGSGALTLGVPSSPGVTVNTAKDTLIADYNNLAVVADLFKVQGDQIACVLIEPIAGNMGLVLPEPEFLEGLRELCDQYGALLIFDEVMTGFRVSPSGAESVLGVRPDLSTFGKIIGGGMPVGAFGGRADVMQLLAPEGPVYQAGTLSGNPIAMAAGLATLTALSDNTIYHALAQKTADFQRMLQDQAKAAGVPVVVNAVCGMIGLFFTDAKEVCDFKAVSAIDTKRYAAFFHSMLDQGIYLPPSAFETWFLSAAHTEQDIEKTAAAVADAFHALKQAV